MRARASDCEGGARRVLLQRSLCAEGQGELIGRDPCKVTPADWQAAGIEPVGVMRAIRAKCLDCVGYQPGEVRKCTAVTLPHLALPHGHRRVPRQTAFERGGVNQRDGLAPILARDL